MKIPRARTSTIAIILLLLPSVAVADPIAKWVGPWSPTKDPLTISSGLGGDATAFRDFGDLGDAELLPDTAAKAISRATADSATFGGGSATTGVAFNRSFNLSGSPEGWNVTLSGRLVGLLFAASPTAPSATVNAGAEIIAGGPVLNWAFAIAPDRQRSIDDAMVGQAILADGTYNVVGFLRTSASVSASGNPLSTGSAKADFASLDPDGFFVGVDATPIPEPATWLLVPTAVGLAWLAHKKRRAAKKSQ